MKEGIKGGRNNRAVMGEGSWFFFKVHTLQSGTHLLSSSGTPKSPRQIKNGKWRLSASIWTPTGWNKRASEVWASPLLYQVTSAAFLKFAYQTLWKYHWVVCAFEHKLPHSPHNESFSAQAKTFQFVWSHPGSNTQVTQKPATSISSPKGRFDFPKVVCFPEVLFFFPLPPLISHLFSLKCPCPLHLLKVHT